MRKDLLLIEINECDFKYFQYGSKKYNYTFIKKFFLEKKKIYTNTDDKKEGFNLDPWVQWVSVHTGKLSKNHKIYRLGQKLDKSKSQIWDKLSKKNISSTIWGVFNGTLKIKKNIDLFFPDPWSFKEKAFPENYNKYLKLPRYYAQNYPNISKKTTIYFTIIFLKKLLFSKCFFYFLKNFFNLFKIFLISGLKSFNLYFFLDLASLLILENNLKKKKSDFTIIALNSFAHYQHNFWNDKKYEKIYFWYLNEMIKIIDNISKNYKSLIIFNGFSQKKIKNEYHLRPRKPKIFFNQLKLDYLSIEPDMTSGAIVYFKTYEEKFKAIRKLKSLKIYNYSIFEVQDYKNKKKIFYKFSIVSLKNKYNPKSLKKKFYKIFFKKPSYLKKSNNINSNNKNIVLIDTILRDAIFIRSTSRHISRGELYYKDFNFSNKDLSKNNLPNTKVFNNILNHFK